MRIVIAICLAGHLNIIKMARSACSQVLIKPDMIFLWSHFLVCPNSFFTFRCQTPSAVMSVVVFTRNRSISKSDFGSSNAELYWCTGDPAHLSQPWLWVKVSILIIIARHLVPNTHFSYMLTEYEYNFTIHIRVDTLARSAYSNCVDCKNSQKSINYSQPKSVSDIEALHVRRKGAKSGKTARTTMTWKGFPLTASVYDASRIIHKISLPSCHRATLHPSQKASENENFSTA